MILSLMAEFAHCFFSKLKYELFDSHILQQSQIVKVTKWKMKREKKMTK